MNFYNLKKALVFCSLLFVLQASSQWSYIGGNITPYNAYPSHYSFAFDHSDTPYVAFAGLGNQYVVTVKKLLSGAWQNVGTPGFITGSGLFYQPGISIAINPIDNMPYIAISDDNNNGAISVLRYNGSQWVYTGVPGFSSAGACGVKLLFNAAGVPHVSFSSCYSGSGLSVMRFAGGAWSYVGSPDFAAGNYSKMVIAPDNSISIAFADPGAGSRISVMTFNGGGWVYSGAAGFSDDAASNISIAADSSHALYVSYTDYSHSDKITVKKLVSGAWATLGSPSFSMYDTHYTDITISRAGAPYVSYVDHVFPVVKKYKNGDWVNAGGYVATTTCYNTAIRCDTLGNPYVLAALQPSSDTYPFLLRYKPCNDTDYHLSATAAQDSAIAHTGDSTTVHISATGGVPPYTGTGIFRVPAGYYTYTITDRNGCTALVSISVNAPCTENYWNGSNGTGWGDPANWSCGKVPDAQTNVYIEAGYDNYPIIATTVACKALNISPGASCNVSATGKVNITGQ